jgi:hypothetical protein
MKVAVVILGSTVLLLLSSCALESSKSTNPHDVRYEVSYQNPPDEYTSGNFGDFGQADLTFSNADGGSSQVSEARLPWVLRFTAKGGAHVYISAQTKYRGLIRVSIYVDEALYKTSTSEGKYVIATASGIVN